MEDIEIARNTKLEPIMEIAQKLGLQEDNIETYGKYKAKISLGQHGMLPLRRKKQINSGYRYKSNTSW